MFGVARHIMRDPAHWKNPLDFDPERFIEMNHSTGKLSLKKEERFIPFGIGETNTYYILNFDRVTLRIKQLRAPRTPCRVPLSPG